MLSLNYVVSLNVRLDLGEERGDGDVVLPHDLLLFFDLGLQLPNLPLGVSDGLPELLVHEVTVVIGLLVPF